MVYSELYVNVDKIKSFGIAFFVLVNIDIAELDSTRTLYCMNWQCYLQVQYLGNCQVLTSMGSELNDNANKKLGLSSFLMKLWLVFIF